MLLHGANESTCWTEAIQHHDSYDGSRMGNVVFSTILPLSYLWSLHIDLLQSGKDFQQDNWL